MLSEFFNSALGHAAVWFALLWAILLFIRKVSKDADNDLNPETRKALSDELLRIKDREASSWVPDFTAVFDRFFGTKHLRWRCFYRSILVSIFTFSALAYLSDHYGTPYIEYDLLVSLITVSLIFNGLIDYISLLQTRIILNAPIPILAKIILDGILTTLLSILWLAFTLSLIAYDDLKFLELMTTLWHHLFDNASSSESNAVRIVLATSFATSIWLWLHGLSRVLIRSLSTVQWFMGWLNVKETPLRAIGTTINLIVLTFGVLLFPVYLFSII